MMTSDRVRSRALLSLLPKGYRIEHVVGQSSLLQRLDGGAYFMEFEDIPHWGVGNEVLKVFTPEGVLAACFGWRPTETTLRATGTWVSHSLRRRGLAAAMWRWVFRKKKPSSIKVSVVTRGGLSLVKKLRAEFPEIDWTCWDDRPGSKETAA